MIYGIDRDHIKNEIDDRHDYERRKQGVGDSLTTPDRKIRPGDVDKYAQTAYLPAD